MSKRNTPNNKPLLGIVSGFGLTTLLIPMEFHEMMIVKLKRVPHPSPRKKPPFALYLSGILGTWLNPHD